MNEVQLRWSTQLVCSLFGVLAWAASPAAAQEAVILQHRWEYEPQLNVEWLFDPDDPELRVDLQNLTVDFAEYRLAEARQIVLFGDRLPAADRPAAVKAMMERLRAGESNSQVRQALISAVFKLAADSQAQELWKLAEHDVAVQGFVEEQLSQHKHEAAKATWLARLADPRSNEGELMLAIEGVEALGAVEAEESLAGLISGDATALPVKLAAARALGSLVDAGREELAGELLGAYGLAKEQLAANLLVRHTSAAAREIMKKVLQSSFAPAQIVAYRWFAEHELPQARELAESMLQHRDNSMRLLAVNVLHQFDDAASLRLQAQCLPDRNVTLRRTVRDHLIEKAKVEALQPVVDEILTRQLAGAQWEAVEQAILVTVALGERQRCPQLVQLLDHPRPEVNIRAGWALQALVESTDDQAQILKHCQRWTDRLVTPDPQQPVDNTDIYRLAFLFEAFGRNAYMPADKMLRLYIPKNGQKMRALTRTSAIWALGLIWQGRDDSGLEQPLLGRIMDMSTTEPEETTVKYVAAVALGNFGNALSADELRLVPYRPPSEIGAAVEWALNRLDQIKK